MKSFDNSIRWHLFAGAAAAGFLAAGVGGWAANAMLADAVIAPGIIVVDSNVKKIQHPIGGVIKELLVHNGDLVEAGQVLVRLDDTQAGSELAIHVKRNDELIARQARAEAELASASTITFPRQLTDRSNDPAVSTPMETQERLFRMRREALDSRKAQLREKIAQLRQMLVGLRAQADAKSSEIEWIRKELDGVRSLWDEKLVQFNRVAELQKDLAREEGAHGRLTASMAERNNKIAETELQIIQIDEDLRSEVGEELAALRSEIAICSQRKVAAEDVFSRIQIRAPQDGIVHDMSVSTVGGVIAAGEELMQIVPTQDTLDVLAKIPPESIDQVHVGQTAALRLLAFDQKTTPEVNGAVRIVSPDIVEDEKSDEKYYSARIEIPREKIEALGLKLQPGMPVEAFIRTDDRTAVSYLLKPFDDQVRKMFRER